MYFALAGISLVCAGALYLLAATFFGTLTSIAITAVISSLLWYLLNEFSLRRFVSVDVQDIVKWLLVIGARQISHLKHNRFSFSDHSAIL